MTSYKSRVRRHLRRLLLAGSPLWDPLYVLVYKLRSGYRGPLPPYRNRERIGAPQPGWFVEGGRQDAAVLSAAIAGEAGRPLHELAVLDFGAGCGRIMHHLYPHVGQLFAADVDGSAVAYLARTYPRATVFRNNMAPPLPLPAAAVDVVYSYSVWTHLASAYQERWLNEVARLLKPGGLALITTLGYTGLKLLRESDKATEVEWNEIGDEQLRREGMIYREYSVLHADPDLFAGIDASYGVAVHDPGYIRREWGQTFTVLEVREAALHGHQDLVVLRKP